MADKIIIEILDDGTIKTETDTVSMPNHANAEGFLKEMARLAGGIVKRVLKGKHAHVHGTQHEHHKH